MTYCTNCGKYNSKKICPNCGVKQNTTHRFCQWCGEAINENATICTHCNESVKASKGTMKTILGVLLIIMALTDMSVILRLLCLVVGISLFPPINRIVIQKTKGRKWLRTVRTVFAVILLIVVFGSTPKAPNVVIDAEATKKAEIVFHKEYELKNEASYVLNDSNVYVANEPFDGDENWVLVIVTLDVSAENSFGGMVRKDYKIELLYNYEEGEYYQYFNNSGLRIKIK